MCKKKFPLNHIVVFDNAYWKYQNIYNMKDLYYQKLYPCLAKCKFIKLV